jgi:hypothetical protein
MNIIEMKLAGRLNKQKLPAYFANIHRVPGNDTITVKLISADGEREHIVEADNPDNVYSMAECLQYHLDGCKGTNSMVHDYYRILENFTD